MEMIKWHRSETGVPYAMLGRRADGRTAVVFEMGPDAFVLSYGGNEFHMIGMAELDSLARAAKA